MALPPLNAPAPAPADAGMPPGGPADDTGADQGGGPEVFATILKTPDGKFILVDGDEPEGGEMGDGEPGAMDQGGVDGPTLLKQLMAKIQGGEGGAEDSFGKAFRGEPDATAGGPAPPAPGM